MKLSLTLQQQKFRRKSILKQIFQVVVNLVHKFNLQNNYLYEEEPWSGILA